ncbi:hypothetical protein AOLI_G00119510 [Acnodon oligacanthus]
MKRHAETASCFSSEVKNFVLYYRHDELHRARLPADPEGDDEFSTYKALGLLTTQVRNGELGEPVQPSGVQEQQLRPPW